MKNMITILAIAVALYIGYTLWKKNGRAVLIAKLTEKLGDIPGLAEKSMDELREMWESTQQGGEL